MFESKRFSSPLCNCWIDYFVSFDKKVIVYGNLIYSHHNDILIITIGILEIVEFEKYFNKFRDKKKLLESFTMNNHDDSFMTCKLTIGKSITKITENRYIKNTCKKGHGIICKLST